MEEAASRKAQRQWESNSCAGHPPLLALQSMKCERSATGETEGALQAEHLEDP